MGAIARPLALQLQAKGEKRNEVIMISIYPFNAGLPPKKMPCFEYFDLDNACTYDNENSRDV
jgi:hypothetical protein